MRIAKPGRIGSALLTACATAALAVVPASAVPAHTTDLGSEIDADSVNRHLVALQRIADQHHGNRASGTPGYGASVDYVAGKLRSAGFDVTTPEFQYQSYFLDSITLSVDGAPIRAGALEYSPSTPRGGLAAPLSVATVDQTPGCEPTDYDGKNVTGTVVLIQRGACDFGTKQRVAADRGAAAAIVYNNVDGPLRGTLGGPAKARIPTASVDKATGQQLAKKAGVPTQLDLRSRLENIKARNVIAQTRTGRPDNVVMAGAHLDSVRQGPGINDNGTGTAGLLEAALRLGGNPGTPNAVRFAFWGAEESGLVGSTKYVQGLNTEQRLNLAMYLNFDMLGSSNAGYFAFDGDNSDKVGAGPGPHGSGQIEKDFVEAMRAEGVGAEGTDLDGRSDYGEFIAAGIPAGGLFSGAEGVKTPRQAEKWGGTAGQPFDSNYHKPSDHLSHVDRVALERNSRALATVIGDYAESTEGVNGERGR